MVVEVLVVVLVAGAEEDDENDDMMMLLLLALATTNNHIWPPANTLLFTVETHCCLRLESAGRGNLSVGS